jgi:hypothetical protein
MSEAEASSAPAAVESAPAVAPETTQVAPAQPESLIPRPPAAEPAPEARSAPATGEWFTRVPEKFLVKTEKGEADPVATLLKATESYKSLEKMKTLAPATPTEYAFTPPAEMAGLMMDDAESMAFREKAHKAGLSQDQYQMIMSEYLDQIPKLMEVSAKLTADQARTELSRHWQGDEMQRGIEAATRAIHGVPADIANAALDKFGSDPDFLRFASHYGKQMKEGTAPPNADGSGATQTIDTLMTSEAYRNPKHPDHQSVSLKVSDFYRRTAGSNPAMM